ncbi:MAG TPA: ABC-F family ATP-binding cassette domain-containing protein [Polyangiaceae bacterium]
MSTILGARGLSKSYGPQTLFSNVSLAIARGERVGLLGVNGTGKSTLLRVLAGEEPADEGTIDRRRDASILYLPQEPALDADATPRTIVERGLAEWKTATSRHEAISRELATGVTDALLAEQSHLAERIEQLGGWGRGHVAEDMLSKLGVREIDRPVGPMSGGERRRVALAQVLVARPTLAILDEPTNHLDTIVIDWLEEFLANEWQGAILMVTHDRYVLDAICDRILELDRGTLHEYQGGYGAYLEQKADRLAHEERAEANRLNAIRREKAWLMRGAKARSTKQKARIQRAKALIADDPIALPKNVELTGLEGGAAELGKSVLDLEGVSVTIAGRVLVRDLELHLVSRDRIGVVGPNGAGKTSLLRVVTGELAPSAGTARVAPRTKIALFDQARAQLRDDWSILDNVAEREGAERTGAGVVTIGPEAIEMRSYLEKFLFEGSKQRQKVGSLSGGERARVALAKILKDGSNLLLLDEPTNDLDVATLSALEELLESWPGCVLAVSHDRWFLDRVATSMLVFEEGGRVVRYPGNWSTYVSLRPPPVAATGARASAPPPPKVEIAPEKKPLTYAERIELDAIMGRISEAEEKLAAIEKTLSDPAIYAENGEKARSLAAELEPARAAVTELLARWELLESRRDLKRS